MDNGYNPLQWDCSTQGCFNRRKRPKIEMFASCLPGRIAFSDIDGVVEVQGNFLFLEWKSHGEIPLGQKILFQRLTQFAPATVLIVEGNAETMEVDTIRYVSSGHVDEPFDADVGKLSELIEEWSTWALCNPASHRRRIAYHSEQIAPTKEVTHA